MAVERGLLQIIKFIHKKNPSFLPTKDICKFALMREQMEILDWFHEKGEIFRVYSLTIEKLANNGKLNSLKWLEQKEYLDQSLFEDVYYGAILGEKIEVLEWIKDKTPTGISEKERLLKFAEKYDRIQSFIWILKMKETLGKE